MSAVLTIGRSPFADPFLTSALLSVHLPLYLNLHIHWRTLLTIVLEAADTRPSLFAVPYEALPQLGQDLHSQLEGKVVLDACNPAPGSDSPLTKEAEAMGVGETSVKYLPGTRLVRAFSAVDAYSIESRVNHTANRVGVPIAGNDPAAVKNAAQLVLAAGCDPVIVGDLASAKGFQRGGPGFRANTTAAERRRMLGLSAMK